MSIPRSLRVHLCGGDRGVDPTESLGFDPDSTVSCFHLGFDPTESSVSIPPWGVEPLHSKASVSSLWQRVRNRVPPTVSNPVPRARAAFWITDDRVSIPMGFEPAWVSIPRVRTRLLGSIPMGFEPAWVSIPRVRTRLLGFDPDGVRTRLVGFDP